MIDLQAISDLYRGYVSGGIKQPLEDYIQENDSKLIFINGHVALGKAIAYQAPFARAQYTDRYMGSGLFLVYPDQFIKERMLSVWLHINGMKTEQYKMCAGWFNVVGFGESIKDVSENYQLVINNVLWLPWRFQLQADTVEMNE